MQSPAPRRASLAAKASVLVLMGLLGLWAGSVGVRPWAAEDASAAARQPRRLPGTQPDTSVNGSAAEVQARRLGPECAGDGYGGACSDSSTQCCAYDFTKTNNAYFNGCQQQCDMCAENSCDRCSTFWGWWWNTDYCVKNCGLPREYKSWKVWTYPSKLWSPYQCRWLANQAQRQCSGKAEQACRDANCMWVAGSLQSGNVQGCFPYLRIKGCAPDGRGDCAAEDKAGNWCNFPFCPEVEGNSCAGNTGLENVLSCPALASCATRTSCL